MEKNNNPKFLNKKHKRDDSTKPKPKLNPANPPIENKKSKKNKKNKLNKKNNEAKKTENSASLEKLNKSTQKMENKTIKTIKTDETTKTKEEQMAENSAKLEKFNMGEFKKKFDKKYILNKLNKSSNFKKGLSTNPKNLVKNTSKDPNFINHNNLNITLTENLFKKAKEMYDEKVK